MGVLFSGKLESHGKLQTLGTFGLFIVSEKWPLAISEAAQLLQGTIVAIPRCKAEPANMAAVNSPMT